jgi:hypothetical protein
MFISERGNDPKNSYDSFTRGPFLEIDEEALSRADEKAQFPLLEVAIAGKGGGTE